MTYLLSLVLAVGGGALYFMTPDERGASFQAVLRALRFLKAVVLLEGVECNEFAEALRARTRRVVAAPLIIAFSAAVSIFAFFEPSSLQGGWRHVAAAIMAHPTAIELLVNVVCLVQLGLILERLVGAPAFAIAYISAGAAAGFVGLSTPSTGSNMGASASILGLYGLLLVVSAWGALRRSDLTIPLAVITRLAAVFTVFVLCQALTNGLAHLAFVVALTTGAIAGLAVAPHVSQSKPPVRRLATCMATIVAITGIYAVLVGLQPQKPVLDVGPEISRVVAIEHYTSTLYDKAAERFRKGRIPVTALVDLIEHTIRPELRVLAARLHSLPDIPPEHRPLVIAAEKFLQSRDGSWATRAAALQRSDTVALRQADAQEQVSLAELQRVKALN